MVLLIGLCGVLSAVQSLFIHCYYISSIIISEIRFIP